MGIIKIEVVKSECLVGQDIKATVRCLFIMQRNICAIILKHVLANPHGASGELLVDAGNASDPWCQLNFWHLSYKPAAPEKLYKPYLSCWSLIIASVRPCMLWESFQSWEWKQPRLPFEDVGLIFSKCHWHLHVCVNQSCIQNVYDGMASTQ